jgi:hypothetical protein
MQQQRQQFSGEDGGNVVEEKFDVERLPNLEFREAGLSESWGMVWADFLILFLLIACFFMVAYVGFVRSDVR